MADAVIDRAGLDRLVEVLAELGHRVVGPVLRDGAIVLAELSGPADLATGWAVDTAPGRYRLRRRDDDAVFGHSAGPQSWKQFRHPARRRLWSTDRATGEYRVEPPEETRYAFLGVRACDLAALGVLDGVLRNARDTFLVAVNCTEPGGVCFCASMNTGPDVRGGHDLALTEVLDAAGHRFLVEVGSPAGAAVLDRLPHRPAEPDEAVAARAQVTAAADRMGRAMPELDLRALLRDSREAAHWQDVADRCLSCGNCTMVCPTCFCTSTEDVTDLTGDHAERWEHWASCFEPDFSHLHGGNVRDSTASRYRQWLSHKLSTWHDQFGTSGCVGCGRCIAWCPVGIDVTVEVARLAEEREARDDRD